MSNLPAMPKALRHDWENLTALIDATAERQTVPCRNGDAVPHLWWTSDSTTEQAAAATECERCPVHDRCRQHGIEHPHEVGCYGGLTERERVKAARQQKRKDSTMTESTQGGNAHAALEVSRG